ncbi:secretin N-terminal domain-containing protein [Pseudoalteromonas shioyasakiensis]|uniref:secretin N-terminal domain-containing protein n=1 Tax=Pseudoalteromonas shioyasakiensis TaxID=1190813 RepID=UPI001C3C4D46|nr:secretin N-terminal domain-containing protein [Pseudoalteromonas shioyasakiensis]
MKSSPYKSTLLLALALAVSGCVQTGGLQGKDLKVERSILKQDLTKNESQPEVAESDETPNSFNAVKVQDLGGISKLKEDAKKPPELTGEPITFAADEISVKEFTSRVFDELLNLNYVVAPQLAASNDKITLNISSPIERSEFYKVVVKTLEESAIQTLRKDDIIYLSKVTGSSQKNSIGIGIGGEATDVPDMAGAITQIVPYVYSGSRNISSIMGKLSTAAITVQSQQKLIIVEGDRAEILRALRIIKMLDVPRAYGREIRLVEFAHISPIEGIEQIRELLAEDGMLVSTDGDVSFVPIPRINAFVAYAANEDIVNRIIFWANKIDVPIAGDERQYFVYKPKYAKAETMLESISSLLLGGSNRSATTNQDQGSAEQGNRGRKTSVDAGPMRFSLDRQQNALIFYTTNDEYRLVESLLKKMDVLPGQVILDVTILEVNLSDDMSSGIDWVYNSLSDDSDSTLLNLASSGSISSTIIKGDWQAKLNWSNSKGNTRVLSRPYMIVRDGESATITSGDQVPIVTQTVEDIGDNNSVANSIQYRSTGVNVAITPIINSQGVISLSVAMSVSNAQPNDTSGADTPVITNRAISTEILSADGQTVALGGLIQETKSDNNNGVPLLSSLPVLGGLFSSKSDSNSRTELVMLITTKVVNDSSEVDEFSEAMSKLYSTPITIK